MPAKGAKRPGLAPVSRYEVLASTLLPGVELDDARLLPLELIDPNPYQSRQAFDLQSLQDLADSISEHGVIEPIVVRSSSLERHFVIVAGERRYRAASIAGLHDIPARIVEMDEVQAAFVTALENLQREDLDLEDEARQFVYLLELSGLSQRRLAEKLGKDHNYISRRIRLLKRPDLLADYGAGKKSLTQVLALVGSDPDNTVIQQDLLITIGQESGEQRGLEPDIELIEREDLPGYLVTRTAATQGYEGHSRASTDSSQLPLSRFRWRPAMHFKNWLERTKPDTIPPEERASFKAQIEQIKTKLEEWERTIEEWEQRPGE